MTLLVLEFAALFRLLPNVVPVVAAALALPLLARRAHPRDFTLIPVFAALFVGVEGLRRASWFEPISALAAGGSAALMLCGALLSQLVSNVPAALLLAPSVPAGSLDGAIALLYGVNAGGCGTPHSSLANLIGAGLLLRMRKHRPFWGLFLKLSFALFGVAVLLSLGLLALT